MPMPAEDTFKRKGEYAPGANDSVMCENPVPLKYSQFDETGGLGQQTDIRLAMELARKRRANRKCAYCRNHKTFCILLIVAIVVILILLISIAVAYAVGLLWPDDLSEGGSTNATSDQYFHDIMNEDELSILNSSISDFSNSSTSNKSHWLDDTFETSTLFITLPAAVIIDGETSTLSRKTRCPSSSPNFICDNEQKTIPFYQRCDGDFNCADGTDEIDCKQCRTSFKCASSIQNTSMCLKGFRLCDGNINCHDWADEREYCRSVCRRNEYRCKNANICVPQTFLCDGDKHCPSGDDEGYCPTSQSCHNHALWCNYTKKCIAWSAWCDYKEDCQRLSFLYF